MLAGADDEEIEGVEVVARAALEASSDDVLAADGYLLATPANFGYMSGALKHFFDTRSWPIGGSLSDDGSPADSGGGTAGRPFGLLVHGRYDTTGAVRSVLSIVGGLGWRQSAEVLEVMGDVERRPARCRRTSWVRLSLHCCRPEEVLVRIPRLAGALWRSWC